MSLSCCASLRGGGVCTPGAGSGGAV